MYKNLCELYFFNLVNIAIIELNINDNCPKRAKKEDDNILFVECGGSNIKLLDSNEVGKTKIAN